MKLTGFRKHLTGEAEFMSYVPTPLTEIHVVHTAELDGLIEEVENSVRQLNAYASQLPYDHIRQLMLYEAEISCIWRLADRRQTLTQRQRKATH